jgi:hypothetical protein
VCETKGLERNLIMDVQHDCTCFLSGSEKTF